MYQFYAPDQIRIQSKSNLKSQRRQPIPRLRRRPSLPAVEEDLVRKRQTTLGGDLAEVGEAVAVEGVADDVEIRVEVLPAEGEAIERGELIDAEEVVADHLGLAVLAGFGAVRFLKSSAGTTSQSSAPSTGASQVRSAGHIDARPASERQVASQMPSDSAFPGAQR